MSGALRNRQVRSIVNRLLIFSTPVHSRLISTLAFDEVRSSPDRPYIFTALILHGLLGSGRNWRSFSRSLASSLPSEWRMILVDLRNHGRSAEIGGFEPPHTMENAANDVANLVKSQGWNWPDVVIGHSMGGKVTLQFAQSCSRGDYGQSAQLPKQLYFPAVFDGFMGQCGNSCFIDINSTSLDAEQLWILDSVPGKVGQENSDGEVEKVLQTLQSLPSSIPSRKWLVDYLLKLGFSKALSEWLGSNLKKSGDEMTWTFNIDAAVQMFQSYRETDYWPLLEHPPKGTEISIVRAEKSDRWEPEVIERLESLGSRKSNEAEGKFSYHILPNSGHWVHVENPKGLLQIVAPNLSSPYHLYPSPASSTTAPPYASLNFLATATFAITTRASAGNDAILPKKDDDDGVSLGTMKLPLDIDLERFDILLFQFEDNGETQVLVYIDCVVSPATNTSPTPMFRATRNGAKKDEAAPGEPRIMRSLLAALQKSVEIARV
nr:protein ABHD11 [Ipomoea batatas]